MLKINRAKGTRDFTQKELILRNKIIKIIKKNFELFGFFPIETPALEMLSNINKVYDIESSKLIFHVINSNNNYKNIANQALRYDLTLPMIRYYCMHKENIFLPFKRYQIQPVWRAENPQYGRFREFYQCDADIISFSDSIWNEIELIKLYDSIFFQLNIPIKIEINHRCILYGLSEFFGIKDSFYNFIVLLDKLEKIGIEKFKVEISKIIKSSIKIDKLISILTYHGSFEDKLKFYKKNILLSENVKKAIEDISFIHKYYTMLPHNNNINFNISLARGLNYYTGTIFEIKSINNIKHSLGGGGRYDKILINFGIKNRTCVGISIGLDRVYLVMESLGLFNKININYPTKIMFINFGNKEVIYSYKCIEFLRLKSISVELYPNANKIKKQIQYAIKKKIHFIAILGYDEINKKIIKIKNLKTNICNDYKNINDFYKINKTKLVY